MANSGLELRLVFGVVAAMAIVLAATPGCSKAVAQQVSQPTNRAIELTIYKDDFAMVSEKRPVEVTAGHSSLAVDDISKQLDPDSVLFDWQDRKEHPEVVATTYNLGVGNGSSLLSKLNGQQVDMIWPSNDGKPGETITGRLEAAQQGESFALRTKDKLYVNPGGTIVASAATASTLPQLSVELENERTESTKLGLSYLTRGMSWSAEYVAKLAQDADLAEFECWATVKNTTGVAFPMAKLTLMAGSPNRAARSPLNDEIEGLRYARADVGRMPAKAVPPRPASPEAVGDLYAYKVPSTATIGQDQMSRVSMLGTKAVPIKKDYAIRLPSLGSWYFADGGAQAIPHITATLSISFVNDESSNLGMPLPSGSVRVYDKDADGHEIYTGAASIGDTPKKEHVNLTVSNVFDVYAEYKVLKTTRVDKHNVRQSVEAILHNEKKSPATVRMVQGYESRWTPVVEPEKYEKLDALTAQWKILLQPGEERKVDYTVDLRG
jgi:hypothetical protein